MWVAMRIPPHTNGSGVVALTRKLFIIMIPLMKEKHSAHDQQCPNSLLRFLL